MKRNIGWGPKRSLNGRASAELGWATFLACKCVTNPKVLWTLCFWDFYGDLIMRHDWLLTPLPALSPLWRMQGRAESSKRIIMASGDQSSARNPPSVPSWEQKMLLEIPRDLGALQQQPGDGDQYTVYLTLEQCGSELHGSTDNTDLSADPCSSNPSCSRFKLVVGNLQREGLT